MRIAIVHPRMDVKGGAENIVVWLADGLQRRGHEVSVIAERYEPEHWPEKLTRGLDVKLLPKLTICRIFNSNRVRFWERAWQLSHRLKACDVVIGQHFPSYCWATRARKRRRKSWRVVWLCQEPLRRLYPDTTDRHLLRWEKLTPPGVENPHLKAASERRLDRSHSQQKKDDRNRKWDAQGAAQCDLVVTNSAFTGGNVKRIFNKDSLVCHLGIPLPPEGEYRRGEYIGVLTTLAVRKNVQNVIRAVSELVRRGRKEIHLRIAGRGPDRAELEALAAGLGVSGNVEFTGGLPDEDLSQFYRRARVAVYCPIDEPFGLVPLEALAVKTPVVVSDHGGPAETIEHCKTGLHANPFDPSDIADAIERLWTDETTARRIAEAGSRKVREYYSLDAFVDRFEKIITEEA